MANSLIEDVLNEPISDGDKGSKKSKNKKSNKFIIIMIILLLIIIVAAIIVIVYLQQNTTTISSKAKFFEVLGKNNVDSVYDVDLYNELLKKLENENSSSEAEIDIGYTSEDFSISNIVVSLDSESDVENQKYYTDLNLSYSDNDLFNLECLASSEAIALKSDEIVTNFVGATYEYIAEELINNSDIDDYDSDSTNIQDDIENFDMSDLKDIEIPSISEESIEVYKNILDKNLDDSHFSSKEVTLNMDSGNVDATEYTLTLSETEFISVMEQILEAFETDTETIDSLVDILNLFGLTDSDLITAVDDLIQELNEYESDETETILIKVYDSNNQTVKISIEYSDITIEIEYVYGDTENSMKMTTIENGTGEGVSIKFINKKSDLSNDFDIEISLIEDSVVTGELIISTNILKSGSDYDLTIGISCKYSDYSLNINITNEIQFTDVDVEELTDENCVLLDNLTEEERETLLNSIYERTEEVLNEKLNELSFIDTNTTITSIEQNISTEDETDESAKSKAKEDLISKIQEDMTEAVNNGEEYTLQNLEGLQVEGHNVEINISDDLAVVAVDGYVFNIDSDFNLSEE